MDPKMELISVMCQIKNAEVSIMRDVARAVIAIHEISSKSLLLMKKLAYRELEMAHLTEKSGIVGVSSLYKDDSSFANQVLTQYCTMIARSALSKPITALVKKLNSSEKNYEASTPIDVD
jgi:hypothetical protein